MREEESMQTIRGPALYLAQFAGDTAPFDSWPAITAWAASMGYSGVQVSSWDARLFDLELAATSADWRDEFLGIGRENGVAVTELSCHLQGQLVAVHPAYDAAFDAFAPAPVHGHPAARQAWAVGQVETCIRASAALGLTVMPTFSGALAWPYLYPWPQRAPGLVDLAFDTLAARWRPLLDLAADMGVDVAYEIHPGEDLHDGASFEMFLDRVDDHLRRAYLAGEDVRTVTSTTTGSAPSMSRMPSSTRPAAAASMAASSPGRIAPDAFAARATGRSTSAAFSRN